MYALPCCVDCASNLGAAPLFSIDDPTQPAPPVVAPAEDQRQTFDDVMSLLSVLSIVINLTR